MFSLLCCGGKCLRTGRPQRWGTPQGGTLAPNPGHCACSTAARTGQRNAWLLLGTFPGRRRRFPSHPMGAGQPSGGSALPRAHLPPKSRRRLARDGHTPPARASRSHGVRFGLARSGSQLLTSLLEQPSPPLPAASPQGGPN